jgi:glutaminyl-tRNA synthetase
MTPPDPTPPPNASPTPPSGSTPKDPKDFVRTIVEDDLRTDKWDGRVHTRFPPEPNGYLHIGHAKSICLNFGIALEYGGKCNLRFDDTNPTLEEEEYVEAIQEDVRWLGFAWEGEARYASDYFDQLYDWAVQLIKQGDAYVDSHTADEIAEYRGTVFAAGKASPYRDRGVEESLDLFARMRAGEFKDGEHVLRAKIDLAHNNMNMRDPVMYRIRHESHHRTGDKWCIYPMYDWAHGESDSIEGITHSICTLEFEHHRPLYDWFLDKLGVYHPQQIEFARLNLTYTLMSKRKLLKLIEEGVVAGWDDPRLPTIVGMRRRGYTPAAIRSFCDEVGVAKMNSVHQIELLEHHLREDLNKHALRVMAVLNPLKVILDNYPAGQTEDMDAVNNPEDEGAGMRKVPFSGELWIERDDFMEDPPKKFFRLAPGREVRLRYGYFVTCVGVDKDADSGEITAIHCTYDPETRGGSSPDGRKVKGTIHWVSAQHAVPAEVRLYDKLFATEDPEDVPEGSDFHANLNPESLVTLTGCMLEPGLRDAQADINYQFERKGYFVVDRADSKPDALVFNRTVGLRDSWAKMQKREAQQKKK